MFTVDVVTLFPEIFAPFVGLSIVGRAVERNRVAVHYHHLLDELVDGERADDAPFGGGAGMVLRIEPIARALDRVLRDAPNDERRLIVVPSPSGRRFTQARRGALRSSTGSSSSAATTRASTTASPRSTTSRSTRWATSSSPAARSPALAIMDATVRLLAGALASRIARERILCRRPARLPRASPGRRPFAASTSRRCSSPATMPRSPSGAGSSRVSARRTPQRPLAAATLGGSPEASRSLLSGSPCRKTPCNPSNGRDRIPCLPGFAPGYSLRTCLDGRKL